MKRKLTSRHNRLKKKLGLPDLEQAKIAVIVSLRSFESQRSYRHSIDEFVAWYCSTPRLSFNKAVVLRYRLHLEDRNLAAGTINVRLAAVRRLAYEVGQSAPARVARKRPAVLRWMTPPGWSAHGPGLRVDHRNSGAVPLRQANRHVRRDDSV